ncbi:hypothetical protein [Streptomyces phaeochromogenes]|uniref:hypothetical protein n=1 Tax=Streptomyces phaeochromogenes TaxID=1923 RepID=UPI0038647964|nr:hypothetical protein OHB08_09135 [Streptomyces phaeochromogenes]
MTKWGRPYALRTAELLPVLLDQVEAGTGGESVWRELETMLCVEGETLVPGSLAALPRLVALASCETQALEMAGAIVRSAMSDGQGERMFVESPDAIAELRELVDRRLRTRPADYLWGFRTLLAIEGQFHWSAALGDFSDDFYTVDCPHCGLDTTVAIGGYGNYSARRDWEAGDVDRRDLRPASVAELDGTGRWMYDLAVRDAQDRLAEGITYLMGRAECPRCASVFRMADEYAAANLPPSVFCSDRAIQDRLTCR